MIMPRIWFKKEMAQQILSGNKMSTTRYKEMSVAEPYDAVSGSRFKAKVFARIRFVMAQKTTWAEVTQIHYYLEGFKTPNEMEAYLRKNKLIRNGLSDVVYYHEFIVISKTEAQAPLGAEATEYPPEPDNSQLPCGKPPADCSAKA